MSGGLRAGAAEVVLPSAPGLDLSGFVGRDNPATGKHDELWARALALESGGVLLVVLTADLLGLEADDVRRVRERVGTALAAAGEPAPDGIAVCCTHTHSAPAAMRLRGCGEPSPAFVGGAVRALSDAALLAVAALRPARIGTGSDDLPDGVCGNRRTPAWTRGGNAPDEAGVLLEPWDREVGVLRVDEDATGAPLACLVNAAFHPVILGPDSREISADWPGVVCAGLREQLGGAVVLFANGAAADVNPARRGTWSDVERAAEAVTAAARRAWEAAPARAGALALGARSEQVCLPLLPAPPPAELEEAARRARIDLSAAAPGTSKARIAAATLAWATGAAREDAQRALRAEVQALRVGDAALVAVPGELFAALGLSIKKRLAARGVRPAWVLGYANGNVGYLPARGAYAEGGYEVESAHRYYGRPACIAPEGGEEVVRRAVALAAAAAAGKERGRS